MAKLYREPDGTWALPGQQSRQAARVDVSTAPIDLVALLNGGARQPITDGAAVPIAGNAPDPKRICPNCKRTHADAERIAALTDRAAILAALQDHILAGDAQLLPSLLDVMIGRLRELSAGL